METVNQGSTLETLRAGLRGTAHAPGEEGYDEASRAWNLAAHQQPALVVVAGGAADVMAAVRFAREAGMGVGVMATGHGVGAACDGGVLINTSGMRGVRVDPVSRTARVEAGALWKDVIHESQPHGLGGLLGSTSHVGVVGYTMGGGFGWLGRKYGFNAASVREADVITADGELVRLRSDENPRTFSGGSGVVSATSGSYLTGVRPLSRGDALRRRPHLSRGEGTRGAESLRPLDREPTR